MVKLDCNTLKNIGLATAELEKLIEMFDNEYYAEVRAIHMTYKDPVHDSVKLVACNVDRDAFKIFIDSQIASRRKYLCDLWYASNMDEGAAE